MNLTEKQIAFFIEEKERHVKALKRFDEAELEIKNEYEKQLQEVLDRKKEAEEVIDALQKVIDDCNVDQIVEGDGTIGQFQSLENVDEEVENVDETVDEVVGG